MTELRSLALFIFSYLLSSLSTLTDYRFTQANRNQISSDRHLT